MQPNDGPGLALGPQLPGETSEPLLREPEAVSSNSRHLFPDTQGPPPNLARGNAYDNPSQEIRGHFQVTQQPGGTQSLHPAPDQHHHQHSAPWHPTATPKGRGPCAKPALELGQNVNRTLAEGAHEPQRPSTPDHPLPNRHCRLRGMWSQHARHRTALRLPSGDRPGTRPMRHIARGCRTAGPNGTPVHPGYPRRPRRPEYPNVGPFKNQHRDSTIADFVIEGLVI